MIAAAREAYPELSVRRLCALLGVSRAWYYGHQRADLAARSPHEAGVRYVRELEVRANLASRSPHEEADRYANGQSVRARMAAASDAPGWSADR